MRYRFIRPPRVIDPMHGGILPGAESFNETGIQLSKLFAIGNSGALTLSADALQGNSFHPDTTSADFAWLVRAAGSFMAGDNTPCEIGVSLTQGVNNPAEQTKTIVAGADAKTKLHLNSNNKNDCTGGSII